MVAPKNIFKSFENFLGLNKGFSDITRPEGFARTATNLIIDENSEATQRPGGKIWSQTSATSGDRGYRGLATYSYLNSTTGATEQELIGMGLVSATPTVEKLTEGTLTITYSGGATAVLLSFLPNASNVWELDIKEDGTSVTGFPKTYGTGFEASPTALSTLVSDIDGLADYTASATFTTNLPAALLPVIVDQNITSGGTVNYYYFSDLNSQTITFTLDHDQVGFRNPAFLNANDSLLIAPVGDFLFKYDGNSVYRAGMKEGYLNSNNGIEFYEIGDDNTSTVNAGAAAGTEGSGSFSGTYTYAWRAVQKDNTGNEIVGPLVDDQTITASSVQNAFLLITSVVVEDVGAIVSGAQSSVTTITATKTSDDLKVGSLVLVRDDSIVSGNNWVERTITAIDTSTPSVTISGGAINVRNDDPIYLITTGSKGFNRNSAVVNGTQSSVNTITVFDGHTLQIGDTAYFLDTTLNEYLEREITGITSTTITVAGTAVNVTDNNAISANLRIEIYRTSNGGSILKHLETIPNNGYWPQTKYDDSSLDLNLGPDLVLPLRRPDPPPKCSVITEHQSLVILAGDPDNPNTVSFSEPGMSEAFPLASNNFDIPFTSKGPITGLGVDDGTLVVFKSTERALIHGDLATDNFTVEIIKDGIGCEAHDSIEETPIGLIWLSNSGFHRSISTRVDLEFNKRLSIDFAGKDYVQKDSVAITTAQEALFVPRRATAINDFRNKRYICFVPAETGTPGSARYAGSSSTWFVIDYKTPGVTRIYQWDFGADLNAYGGLAIFENELYYFHNYNVSSDEAGNLIKEHNRGDQYDAADNTQPITWTLAPEWIHAGDPSVFKNFQRLRIWVDDPSVINDFTMTIKSYRNFSSSTAHSNFTKSFTSSTKEVKGKLRLSKTRAMQVEFSNAVLHEAPRMTGYELEVIPSYDRNIRK